MQLSTFKFQKINGATAQFMEKHLIHVNDINTVLIALLTFNTDIFVDNIF